MFAKGIGLQITYGKSEHTKIIKIIKRKREREKRKRERKRKRKKKREKERKRETERYHSKVVSNQNNCSLLTIFGKLLRPTDDVNITLFQLKCRHITTQPSCLLIFRSCSESCADELNVSLTSFGIQLPALCC